MSNDIKISIEEVLELVNFTRDSEGRLRISDVYGTVIGDVGSVQGNVLGNVGNVYGNVGNVYGNVGDVYGNVGIEGMA